MYCEKTQADVAQEVFCPHRRISAVTHVVKLPEFLTYLYRLVTFGRHPSFRNDPFNSLHLPRAQPSPVAFNTSSHWTPLPFSAVLLLYSWAWSILTSLFLRLLHYILLLLSKTIQLCDFVEIEKSCNRWSCLHTSKQLFVPLLYFLHFSTVAARKCRLKRTCVLKMQVRHPQV